MAAIAFRPPCLFPSASASSPCSSLLFSSQPWSKHVAELPCRRFKSMMGSKDSRAGSVATEAMDPWKSFLGAALTLSSGRPAKRVPVSPVKVEAAADGPAVMVEEVASDAEILRETSALGATLDSHGGCVFRVWAPHAEAARVVLYEGDSPSASHNLLRQDNFWEARVPNVAAGAKYHFVFSHGGCEHERRDARARQADYSSNACVVVDPRYDWTPFEAPSWDNLNIYQLHVGAFTGRMEGGGTFKALEAQLDHIAGLGFTAIELLPVHEYCGSWGYNPRLLFAVHSPYGTPADLRHLVDSAHKKGLAVIFDVVLNHGAARLNSLWAYDGWNNNNRGGLYFDGGKDTPFGKGFAWWQEEVQAMAVDAAAMFLEEYNGDGLRFDCVHVMPWKLLQRTTWHLHERFPGKILISETTPETPDVISGAGFDATWMHSSFYDMRAFMNERRSLRKLESLLTLHPGYSSPTQCVKYFLGCHDQAGCRKDGKYDPEIQGLHRYAVELYGGRENWEARAKARMWYGGQVAAAGMPMLFMGSEWHHASWWGVDADHMLRWTFADDVIGKEMSSLVREANFLRKESPALRRGSVRTVHFDSDNCVLALRREAEGQAMLVVVNAGERQWEGGSYSVGVGGGEAGLRERLNTQGGAFGGWEGSGNAGGVATAGGRAAISLPKWSVLVFECV